jgi:annexin A7/11
MFDSPFEYDARELNKALNNDIDIDTIIEIFCSRPKSNLELIDLAYTNFFDISLREEIKKKLSKNFSEFLLILMDVERSSEQTLIKNEPYKIAEEIIKNGIKLYTKDINMFTNTFVKKSRKDLILISRAYFELSKKSLYDAIESEVGGKNRRLLKGLLFAVITPAQWFAKKCYKAIQGLGGDNNSLIRVLFAFVFFSDFVLFNISLFIDFLLFTISIY